MHKHCYWLIFGFAAILIMIQPLVLLRMLPICVTVFAVHFTFITGQRKYSDEVL